MAVAGIAGIAAGVGVFSTGTRHVAHIPQRAYAVEIELALRDVARIEAEVKAETDTYTADPQVLATHGLHSGPTVSIAVRSATQERFCATAQRAGSAEVWYYDSATFALGPDHPCS